MKIHFTKPFIVAFATVFLALNCFNASSQTFSHQQNLDNFLLLMSQKGFIEYNNTIKPVDRKYIFSLLQDLKTNSDLNPIEKKELQFYLTGYKLEDSAYMPNNKVAPSFKHFFQKPFDEQHLFLYKDKDFGFIIDPMVQIQEQNVNGNSISSQAIGMQLIGYAGKRLGFQMSYQDVNERGRFDSVRQLNDLPGVVRKQSTDPNFFNYSLMNATISLRLNKGNIVVGQDQNIFGFGKSGNLVLSDKAPAYPFYAINYSPTKWLKFNYMHAWLQSGVVNSSASYQTGNTVYGGIREKFIPKFYAIHSVEFTPMKGLQLNFGESIVYSDQLELSYMLPITFFKAFDNQKFADNILTGSNSQLFMGFSSRNQIPHTHFYGQLFIDEIRVSTLLNAGKSRNQLGFQSGISVADAFTPNLTLNAEYTRINPFVYSNFIPSQNYTNANYALGDWMGNNADRIYMSAQYHPKLHLFLTGYMMFQTKGGAGTIEQQYFAQPQPKFGFDPQYQSTKLGLVANYAFWNNVNFKFTCANTFLKPNQSKSRSIPELGIGIYWNKF
jgi:hypothetical protein